MEINEDQPKEKSKSYLLRACESKGASHCHLYLGRSVGKPAEEGERFLVEKGKSSGVPGVEAAGMGRL